MKPSATFNNFTHEFKTPGRYQDCFGCIAENIVEKPEKLNNYAGIISEQTPTCKPGAAAAGDRLYRPQFITARKEISM